MKSCSKSLISSSSLWFLIWCYSAKTTEFSLSSERERERESTYIYITYLNVWCATWTLCRSGWCPFRNEISSYFNRYRETQWSKTSFCAISLCDEGLSNLGLIVSPLTAWSICIDKSMTSSRLCWIECIALLKSSLAHLKWETEPFSEIWGYKGM